MVLDNKKKYFQVVIKDKALELLLYFTKNEDEEVQTKAIIGLGKYLLSIINEFLVFTFLLHSR